jgi:PAS domain S-box-containing protein
MHGTVAAPAVKEDFITPEEFETVFRLIQQKTGYRFNYYKKSVVTRRIIRRMHLQGIASVQDYARLIADKDAEAGLLASDLMIGVTSFFRDRAAWKALSLEVIRKLAAEHSDAAIRVWTPACSTGEEPYSIAMLLLHELALSENQREVQVFATDVNDRALEKARAGAYPNSVVADLPAGYFQKFFTSADDGLSVINKEVRERVVFAKQDLLNDPPFSKLDLVICRNLLIYLEPTAQDKCISLFHYALKENGSLFLGNAESVGSNKTLFKSASHKKCRIYRKVGSRQVVRLPLNMPYLSEHPAAVSGKPAPVADARHAIADVVQESLLEEFSPAAIAINQHYDILYHSGPTNRYLRQPRGIPTQNLLELFPHTLRNKVRGGIYRAARESKPVSIQTSVNLDGNRKLQVILRFSKLRENLFLILFQEKKGRAGKTDVVSPQIVAVVEENVVRQLETELAATKQDLQSHIEQLKSLNEELHSSNEELQAANEELETSREELQSLNEELVTVNSQLQVKIEEQEETNDDLGNFLSSTNIPTVFLDHLLRVKRFTPAMSKLVQLLPTDAGRPIRDLSQENLGPELIADAQTVLESLVPVKKEVRLNNTIYVRATLPYRTSDNHIEGVVITYNDVTDLKQVQEKLSRAKDEWERTFDSVPDLIAILDNEHRVRRVNKAMAERLGVKPQQCIGLHCYEAVHGLSAPPAFCPHSRTITDSREHAEEVHEDRLGGDFLVTTTPLYDEQGLMTGSVHVAHDITARKRAEENTRHLASFPQLNPNPVLETDASGNILFSNPATKEVLASLGMDKEAGGVFLPDDINNILAGMGKNEKTSLYREVPIKDRVFSTTIQLVPQFNVVRIYAYDITERKQAEEALSKSEERFRLLVTGVKDYAIFMLDQEGNVVTWNAGAERLKGYKAEEIIGQHFSRFYTPEDIAGNQPEKELKTARTIGQAEEVGRRVRKDGSVFWAGVLLTALRDDKGMLRGFAKITRDITERKKAEEELQESEQRVRLKLNSIISPEGDIGNLELGDIIDAPAIQSLMEKFHELTHIPLAIIDLKGKVLVGAGWQDICTKFHRLHPETCGHCIESDTLLTAGMPAGEYKVYKCKNNMWDVGTPIEVGGKQLGHFFTGQFLFDDESPDYEFFRQQAKQYGFDEREYLAALDRVPRLSRATVDTVMEFFIKLSSMISQLSYSNFKLARILSEHDRLMASLRESEERLERAQEIAHLGSWELDLVNNSLSWSDEVYRIFGLLPQEFAATYEAFLERVHPGDRAAVNAAYTDSLRDGKDTYEIEHRVVRKSDTAVRIVLEKCEHFRDGSGKIVRSIGMVHDVTDRKQAEAELFKLNRALKALSDNSQAVIGANGEQDYLDDVCKVLVEDCGYSMVWIGFAEDDEAKSVRPVAYAGFEDGYLATLNITWSDTERGRGPTGTAIRTGAMTACPNVLTDPAFLPWREQAIKRGYASSIVFPLLADGKTFGAVTIYSKEADPFSVGERKLLTELVDNTSHGIEVLRIRAAREKAKEELQQSHIQLAEVNQELEAFIYSVSHDLRAPLRSISGFTKIVNEDYAEALDDKGKDYLTRIHNGAERMSRLIEDLLRLSRISKQGLSRSRVDLSALASQAVTELRQAQPDRSVVVDIKEGLAAFADQRLMALALTNLLGNAWKFTTKTQNAHIQFGALTRNGKTSYYVKDNGAGFDPKYADKMFRPFHRLHAETEYEGTGIGLTIVERVIRRHNGNVWAEGSVGKGATVYFTLG